MSANVDIARDGTVGLVRMHRGGLNAIAADLTQELAEAFTALGADPLVRCVVLASDSDRAFSVGADLTGMAAIDRSSPDAHAEVVAFLGQIHRGYQAISACPKPVVAAIGGHALGGGCELALCCDYRVMVDDGHAQIGQTESALGIIPGAGGTQRLVRLIGRARAMPLLLEARRLTAPEAQEIGLIDIIAPPEAFEETWRRLSERLARGPTRAFALIKDAVNRGQDLPLGEALALEADHFATAALTDDAAIGIMSFLAKQDPEFTGG
ncbi:MAG: enoyl-CoA hydratase/isomerase family protein [Candidatus Dormibacteraeota bacterium]|nr:enoyl-CoA hydratase/isomerase family protein [Candidatus Dormibacteraeota bacterium]